MNAEIALARQWCERARWPEQHRDDCLWCAYVVGGNMDHPETLAWQLAEHGDFSLDFDTSDMRTPDCLPWTLHFTLDGVEHHFAGQNLSELFTWALGFITGKVDSNGRELTSTAPSS